MTIPKEKVKGQGAIFPGNYLMRADGSRKLRQVLEELHFELLKLGPQEKPLQAKVDALSTDLRDHLSQPDLADAPIRSWRSSRRTPLTRLKQPIPGSRN